jgi:hypothetical protein
MFHPEDFEGDPSVLAELEADVAAECSKIGPVERLRVKLVFSCPRRVLAFDPA